MRKGKCRKYVLYSYSSPEPRFLLSRTAVSVSVSVPTLNFPLARYSATKTANNFHNSFLPECNNFCTLWLLSAPSECQCEHSHPTRTGAANHGTLGTAGRSHPAGRRDLLRSGNFKLPTFGATLFCANYKETGGQELGSMSWPASATGLSWWTTHLSWQQPQPKTNLWPSHNNKQRASSSKRV